MGMLKRKQTQLGKEGIGPALMVPATPAASSATAFAQDAAESSPQPLVLGVQRRWVAVLKVLKPSLHRSVQVSDNDLQALAVSPPCLGSNRVSKLPQTLLPWPLLPTLEVISQKSLPVGWHPQSAS